MSTGLYSIVTRATGIVLTAAIYNSDHQNHVTNQNPQMTGGYSDSVSQMQTMTNPGLPGSESLAGSMAGELERIRYCLACLGGTTNWYQSTFKTVMYATAGAAYLIQDSTPALVQYPSLVIDNRAAYDSANARYVVPVQGTYRISAAVQLQDSNLSLRQILFTNYVNGVGVYSVGETWNGVNAMSQTITLNSEYVRSCAVGNTLQMFVYGASGLVNGLHVIGGYLSIEYISS